METKATQTHTEREKLKKENIVKIKRKKEEKKKKIIYRPLNKNGENSRS